MTNKENRKRNGTEYISLIVVTLSASAMSITCTFEEHTNCPFEITNTEVIWKSK